MKSSIGKIRRQFRVASLGVLLSLPAFATNILCNPGDEIRGATGWKPEVLQRNSAAVREKGEKLNFGYFLGKDGEFPKLKDGPYIYLIDEEVGPVFAPRVPDYASPDEYLMASHRALENAFRMKYKRAPKVLAAGEFHQDNGVISVINNKSRTYPAGKISLDYATREFKGRKLPIQDGTKQVDFSQAGIPKNHGLEIEDALAEKFFRSDPQRSKLIDRLFAYRAEFAKRYSGEAPGTVDWSAAFRAPIPGEPLIDVFSKEGQYLFNYLKSIERHDVPYKQLFKAYEQFGPKKFEEVIDSVPQMEGCMDFKD